MSIRKLAAGAAICVLAFAATSAYAQEITGGVAGHVTENGKAVGGAQVQVTNTSTGQSVTTTASDDGFYQVNNLPPGGPYKVTVTAGDKASAVSTVDSIPIGPATINDVDIVTGSSNEVAGITVTATARNVAAARVQTGPRTVFTATDIATKPSFGGDLKDLARINPMVTVDPASSNAVVVAGANNHVNTVYLDGVRQSDDFGLSNGGYPTQRSPFSVSVVQAFNLEVAPYDVQYGNFQGGIFNVVTKSGTNAFHGSAEYTYDSNFNSGHFIGGGAIGAPVGQTGLADRLVTTKFRDKDYDFTFGGPIWPDRAFFFFGYDKYTGIGAAQFNPIDQPGANPILGVTQADVTRVQGDLKATAGSTPGTGYGYDPLNYGGTGPVVDTKWFGRFDFYITPKQHLFFTYQNTDGTTYNVPNGSTSSQILNLQSNDYNFEQSLVAYTGDLQSRWTDNFTTEFEYSYKDVESPTVLFTGPFAEFKVQLAKVPPNTGAGSIFLGPDISRQANNLANQDQQFKLKGHYSLGDHIITGGFEHERLREFDLFVQNATGVYTFSNACGPGLGLSDGAQRNLEAHVACALTYQNAFDNNPATAATKATLHTDTVYVEDEWHVRQGLTVRGGLRYEYYTTPSAPLLNPRFVAQYGFANNLTTNKESILMPRIGFNWTPDPSWSVSGGIGLFSGGNPQVYLYDSFTNPGNLLGTKTYTCTQADCSTQASALTLGGPSALVNVTGSSIPAAVQADITSSAAAGTGIANALDPHFKPPATWKASFSISKTMDFSGLSDEGMGWLGEGWRFHFDFLATKTSEAVFWKDIWELQYPLGTAPDGRPVYDPNRYNVTGAVGGPNAWLCVTGTCVKRTSGSDILLTNTTLGDGLVWALGVTKSFKDLGLDIDYTYTGQHVRDAQPATSSVATSNYNNTITADPNTPTLATSNYQILYEHRISVDFAHKFFGDLRTSVSVFMYDRAGLPFSYAFCTSSSSTCGGTNGGGSFNGPFDQLFGQSSTSTTHQLLYVPKADATGAVTATSDPIVTFGPTFDLAGFNTFLQTSGLSKYGGHIAPRNAFRSPDVFTGDIHLAQELPAWPPKGAKGEVFLDIINFANLLNKNWGIDEQVGFPYVFAPVVAANCQFSGTVQDGTTMPTCVKGQGNFYQYNTFRAPTATNFATVQTLSSPPVQTWVMKMGIRFKF